MFVMGSWKLYYIKDSVVMNHGTRFFNYMACSVFKLNNLITICNDNRRQKQKETSKTGLRSRGNEI